MKRIFALLVFVFLSLALIAQEQIQLRWDPSTDNVGVAGYNIWVNAEYYGTTADTFFVFPTLDPGIYALAVSAFDAAGNESDLSEVLMVEIRDTESPSIPDSLMTVFPNPIYNGQFIVRFYKEIKDNSILQILSPTGQILDERLLTHVDLQDGKYREESYIDLNLAPGLYVIALIENNRRRGFKYLVVAESQFPIIARDEEEVTSISKHLLMLPPASPAQRVLHSPQVSLASWRQ